METPTSALALRIGRLVETPDGRRIGKVIAIIHGEDRVDALIDHRRLLGHTTIRVCAADLVERGERLVLLPQPREGRSDSAA